MASKSGPSNSMSASRSCLCSPTTHPGSFRCSFHRNRRKISIGAAVRAQSEAAMAAKANAAKAFLLQIIKPSSSDVQRRRNFRPKLSRFCLMNNRQLRLAVS